MALTKEMFVAIDEEEERRGGGMMLSVVVAVRKGRNVGVLFVISKDSSEVSAPWHAAINPLFATVVQHLLYFTLGAAAISHFTAFEALVGQIGVWSIIIDVSTDF